MAKPFSKTKWLAVPILNRKAKIKASLTIIWTMLSGYPGILFVTMLFKALVIFLLWILSSTLLCQGPIVNNWIQKIKEHYSYLEYLSTSQRGTNHLIDLIKPSDWLEFLYLFLLSKGSITFLFLKSQILLPLSMNFHNLWLSFLLLTFKE